MRPEATFGKISEQLGLRDPSREGNSLF
jgi:hypothetical protein